MAIPVDSPLSLLNDSTLRGPDRWDWSIWVEGPDAELDRVESVTYRLHPSFPRPVRKISDRGSKFRLSGSGWGEFTVSATANLRSGKTVLLERWLTLGDARGRRPADSMGTSERPPTVFISASAVDGELVADLTKALRAQGIEARREQDVAEASVSATAGIDEALRNSDGVVAVFSEPRSAWVESEFQRGVELNKLTFPVILGEAEPPTVAMSMARFELNQRGNVQGLANMIAARLKDHLVPEE